MLDQLAYKLDKPQQPCGSTGLGPLLTNLQMVRSTLLVNNNSFKTSATPCYRCTLTHTYTSTKCTSALLYLHTQQGHKNQLSFASTLLPILQKSGCAIHRVGVARRPTLPWRVWQDHFTHPLLTGMLYLTWEFYQNLKLY